jgi:hypothetical protein
MVAALAQPVTPATRLAITIALTRAHTPVARRGGCQPRIHEAFIVRQNYVASSLSSRSSPLVPSRDRRQWILLSVIEGGHVANIVPYSRSPLTNWRQSARPSVRLADLLAVTFGRARATGRCDGS